MKNHELANEFSNGATKGDGSHLFIDGDAIYSYGYHFPIAYRLKDGNYLFNKDGYSISTSRHKNYVKNAIENVSIQIFQVPTNILKDAIALRIKEYSELITEKL